MKYDNVKEYSISELKESINEEKEIIIPLYQRGITWKKWQREKLINSLINKYPFGCILLHRCGKDKYRIIDGLQRSYAVIDFYDKPVSYFNEDYISDEEINKIASFVDNFDIKEDIRTNIPDMIQEYVLDNCNTLDELKKIDIKPLISEITNKYTDLIEDASRISNIIKNVLNQFVDTYEDIVETLRIPALLFDAPEEKLPEIFERINKEGAKLTRYQVFAATWSDDKLIIDNRNLNPIITYVKNRYDTFLKEVGSLEGYDSVELTRKKEVNIFDMIYGFGMMLINNYPDLFSNDYDMYLENNSVPSAGFNLINYCLLQKSSDMGNLNCAIKDIVGLDSVNICTFLQNILECVNYVNKKLSKGVSFRGNKNIDKNAPPLHSELQIISIIASLFASKYLKYDVDEVGNVSNVSFNKLCNQSWNSYRKKKFDTNVLKIYAYDMIASKWKGSGDSKVYNILLNNKYYLRDISWEEFDLCLTNYFNNQRNERNESTKVMNPSSVDKLILNLIYVNVFSAKDILGDSGYDIEHLATKGIMKSKIAEYNQEPGVELSLPISSIGNLCLLPKDYNEKKGEKVMYQCTEIYDPVTKTKFDVPISKYERKYTFTTESDFDWLIKNEDKIDQLQFKNSYYKFLENRFKKMKNKIKNNLYQE